MQKYFYFKYSAQTPFFFRTYTTLTKSISKNISRAFRTPFFQVISDLTNHKKEKNSESKINNKFQTVGYTLPRAKAKILPPTLHDFEYFHKPLEKAWPSPNTPEES